jgi:hypothetical protein
MLKKSSRVSYWQVGDLPQIDDLPADVAQVPDLRGLFQHPARTPKEKMNKSSP